MVSRKDFLTQQQAVDEQMIALFKKSAEEVNMLFLQAVEEGDIAKAKHLLARIKKINQTLKREYGEWVKVRIPQEYALGSDYIDWEMGEEGVSATLSQGGIVAIEKKLGPIHKEAVQALVDQSTMLVKSSIDKMQSNILYQITKAHNINIKEKLAVGMIQGKSHGAMKMDFLKELKQKGVSGFRDRGGKFRSTERYADMVVRTETRIANVQGTLNRGMELGITKYKVTESMDACSVCASHHGKVYDLAKGSVELPPYHPNCKGFVSAVVEFWKNNKNNSINPTVLSRTATNSLMNKRTGVKPNRLSGKKISYNEAKTGTMNNGKPSKNRIRLGYNDKNDLIVLDGRHLLEAYRKMNKAIPPGVISYND